MVVIGTEGTLGPKIARFPLKTLALARSHPSRAIQGMTWASNSRTPEPTRSRKTSTRISGAATSNMRIDDQVTVQSATLTSISVSSTVSQYAHATFTATVAPGFQQRDHGKLVLPANRDDYMVQHNEHRQWPIFHDDREHGCTFDIMASLTSGGVTTTQTTTLTVAPRPVSTSGGMAYTGHWPGDGGTTYANMTVSVERPKAGEWTSVETSIVTLDITKSATANQDEFNTIANVQFDLAAQWWRRLVL